VAGFEFKEFRYRHGDASMASNARDLDLELELGSPGSSLGDLVFIFSPLELVRFSIALARRGIKTLELESSRASIPLNFTHGVGVNMVTPGNSVSSISILDWDCVWP